MSLFTVMLVSALLLPVKGLSQDIPENDTTEEQSKKWYKGNLHTHSYWSNGDDYPEMVLDWYKSRNYNFLALSEHDVLSEGEKWVKVKKGTSEALVFLEYADLFGKDWVEFVDQDSLYKVKLKPYRNYRIRLDEPGEFLVLQSEEIHDEYKVRPVHINATNIRKVIKPQGGKSVLEVLQNNLDAVARQQQEAGVSIIPHINHPNINWAISLDDLKQVNGVRFFELFSGHPNARNKGNLFHYSTEEKWDKVNAYNIQNGKPLIYGLAVDDAQDYHSFGPELSNPGRGWIQVWSSELSSDSLMAAMQRGDFYASTGVRLQEIQFDGSTLTIIIDTEFDTEYSIQFIGAREEDPEDAGVVFAEESGAKTSYTLKGNEMFIRAKIISDKKVVNPTRHEEGSTEVAWTQPILLMNKRGN